jgi:hypothetical protein
MLWVCSSIAFVEPFLSTIGAGRSLQAGERFRFCGDRLDRNARSTGGHEPAQFRPVLHARNWQDPGKHIEGLRLEAARPQLELTPATFEEVAMSSLDGSAVLRATIENHSEAGDANIRSRNGKVA